MRKSLWILPLALAALAFSYTRARAGAIVERAGGIVEVQGHRIGGWEPLARTPYPLRDGDRLRTGTRAFAEIRFEDGSTVRVGADATVGLEEASPKRVAVQLTLGSLRAQVRKLLTRRFEVRTPVAVAAVRGTDFRVRVYSGGRTDVDLYSGLLGVEDIRGRQVLLHPSESLRIDRRGMGVPQRAPSKSERRRTRHRRGLRREVGLDQSKDEVLAAAAREIRLAEFQQGKALIDVNGRRVRVEEYILRPRPDQFKLVVLNARESRFDYFYYLGTFNQALPQDLSSALRELGGGIDAAPSLFLTSFETGRSNTVDSMREIGIGGHLVDVNTNGTPNDDVTRFFDDGLDRFVDVAGRSVFKTIFDNYGFYVNGKLKYGWTGANLQIQNDALAVTNTDPITGAALTPANANIDGAGNLIGRSVNVTFPDAGKLNQRISENYLDGTSITWDNYIIDDEGRVAPVSAFLGATSGADFQQRLLNFNYQQVISASEFQGRTIDLVVEPKILIQSGLIQ